MAKRQDIRERIESYVDTAADLRTSCAIGLVATAYPRALIHLVDLVDLLRARWEAQPFKREADRALLRAAALHRSPAALDWLVEVAGRSDRASAETIVAEFAVYRANGRLRERLHTVIAEREDPVLMTRFARTFPAAKPDA